MTRRLDTTRRLAYTVTGPDAQAPHPMGHAAPLPAALEELASLGYDGVEVQVRAPDAAGLATALADAGLAAAALATGPVRGEDGLRLDADRDTRRRTVRRLRDVVDASAELGCLMTLGGVRGAPSGAQAQAEVADAIGEVATHAGDVGVTLALEPQHRGVGPYLCTVAETRALLTERAWPTVAIVADSFHLVREEASWPGALVRAGDLLAHVQLGENHRGPLGTGTLALTETLDVLDALDYRGWLVMEHEQRGGSAAAAAQSIAAIRAATPSGS